MVQVLPAVQKRPSQSQRFSDAILQQLENYNQQKQQKQQLSQENEAIKENFGIDLSGVNDPNQRKTIVAEMLKRQGKEQLQAKKENLFSGIINKGQTQNGSSIGKKLAGEEMGQESLEQNEYRQTNEENFDPSRFSDEDIAKMALFDTQGANVLRGLKDTSLREKREERQFKEKKKQYKEKVVSESFKENQDFINHAYDQYEDSLRREAILERSDQLNESGELSDSGIINSLESLGVPQEWLKNPANEEYSKLTLDLLGGGTLQADYGSKILQSEFYVAQQRIPTLKQTQEGRRQISENIKTMLLPAKLKKERMQYYLDKAERTGEPLPHDLRGKILKDIKPQLEEAYDKFKQRNGRYKVKSGTVPDDNALEKYYYLANTDFEKAVKLMKEDGYDVAESESNARSRTTKLQSGRNKRY